MSDLLRVKFAGLDLSHPIIAASAGTTKDAEHAARAQEAGFSAVVLKSVQEETVNRYNPFPRFAVIRNGVPGYESTSFMSYEQAFEGGIDEYAETVRQAKRRIDIPIIASVNCVEEESWAPYTKACVEAGADAVEVVPSCPVGLFVREAAEFGPVAERAVVEAKRAAGAIPVGVKMTQQLTNPVHWAVRLGESGADWITMFNRSPGLQIDLGTRRPIMHGGIAGHGGPWVVQSVMRWIIAAAPHLRSPISATGGVSRWEDVARYLLCGATTVQVASAVYMKGYGVAAPMVKGLTDYVKSSGLSGVGELIGAAIPHVKSLSEADRSGRYRAEVDPALCVRCGRCRGICIYDAIECEAGTQARVLADRCDGCGLCEQVCGRAISMHRK